MRKAIFAIVAVAVLRLGAWYMNGKKVENRVEEYPRIGTEAPPFALEGLDGKTYSLESLQGKPVVINFWASWCGPCKEEAPELVKLYEQYKGRLEVYAVNWTVNDSKEKAARFARENGFPFPVLLDPEGKAADAYQVIGVPVTFFVNEEGIIEDILPGYGGPEMLEEKFANLASR